MALSRHLLSVVTFDWHFHTAASLSLDYEPLRERLALPISVFTVPSKVGLASSWHSMNTCGMKYCNYERSHCRKEGSLPLGPRDIFIGNPAFFLEGSDKLQCHGSQALCHIVWNWKECPLVG